MLETGVDESLDSDTRDPCSGRAIGDRDGTRRVDTSGRQPSTSDDVAAQLGSKGRITKRRKQM